MKKTIVLAMILLAVFASFQTAFGYDIVYDPTNFGNAVLQLAQLVATVDQLALEYELLLRMAQMVPVNMGIRYRAVMTPWFPSQPQSDRYGQLGGLTTAVNTGANAAGGYSQASEPLDEYGSTLEGFSPETQAYLKNQYSSIELTDGTNIQGIQTIGTVRKNASAVSKTIQGLEDDSLSKHPDMNTQMAVLNKINAASIVQLRTGQDTNKLLADVLEQLVVERKRQRDAATREVNAHILRVREGANVWARFTSNMSESIGNMNIP